MKRILIIVNVWAMMFLGSFAALAAEGDRMAGEGQALQQIEEQEDKIWAAGVGVSYWNKYISKGNLATDGPVMQVNADLELYDLHFNFFGNMDLDSVNDNSGDFNELGFSLDYTFHAWDFFLTVGGTYSTYPNTDAGETWEVEATLGYDWIITPSISVNHDIDDHRGQYLLFALEHESEITSPLPDVFSWSVYLTTGLGWATADRNDAEFEVDDDCFVDYYIGVEIPITICDYFTITPAFYQYWLMDSDIRESTGYDDHFIFGVTVGAAF